LRGSGRFGFSCLLALFMPICFNPLHCGAVVASDPPPSKGGLLWNSFNPLHCGAVVASQNQVGIGRLPDDLVSIPFIAGQWSLRAEVHAAGPHAAKVSIPFIAGQWSLPAPGRGAGHDELPVSIPFIAGQWSLQNTASLGSTSGNSFNPLHCGAVVASPSPHGGGGQGGQVSIPFIAGQWSLRPPMRRRATSFAKFQSPSLRGSGRFLRHLMWYTVYNQEGFNPLHCGAVVASDNMVTGRWRRRVSIPFIAGQWSLRFGARPDPKEAGKFQSPSLRGSGRFISAVLMVFLLGFSFQSPSLRGSGRFLQCSTCSSGLPACFNPLHCGAVVASREDPRRSDASRHVSIPFIAGQWSLPRARSTRCGAGASFQSPSLRGSGRFLARLRASEAQLLVSIPFIAGQWSLLAPLAARRGGKEQVSIPFIAGQWSLLDRPPPHGGGAREFQSPSLRGSGRFTPRLALVDCMGSSFQSPSLRGSGRFANPPFRHATAILARFNPLHCGAVVASGATETSAARRPTFQSPSLRGSGRFLLPPEYRRQAHAEFQSPSLRGSGRFPRKPQPHGSTSSRFQSPSLRGSGRFALLKRFRHIVAEEFQSPSLRGSGRFLVNAIRRALPALVSIPFIAGQWSLPNVPFFRGVGELVSIPFIAGQWSLPDLSGDLQGCIVMFQSPSLRGSGRFF